MRINTIKIDGAKELYDNHLVHDFPKEEVKPFYMIEYYMKKEIYEIYGLYEKEELYSYALFMKNRVSNIQLLDYFACVAKYRNQGYGSKMLQLMKQSQKDIVGNIIEVETVRTASSEEERKLRERRIAFYLRNGLRTTKIRTSVFGVEFDILYMPINQDITDEALFEELKKIYFMMFGEICLEEHVTMELLK